MEKQATGLQGPRPRSYTDEYRHRADPLPGPPRPVCLNRPPSRLGRSRRPAIREPAGERVGRRVGGEPLPHAETRTGAPADVYDPQRGRTRPVRVRRGLVQAAQAALGPGPPDPRRSGAKSTGRSVSDRIAPRLGRAAHRAAIGARRAHVRLDGALAQAGVRPRAPVRRERGHDPPRHVPNVFKRALNGRHRTKGGATRIPRRPSFSRVPGNSREHTELQGGLAARHNKQGQ